MSDDTIETESSGLNISLITEAAKFYGIIGIGFGLLTIILLNTFGGGGGVGLLSGFLVIIIYAYTGMTGPILAAIFGYNQQRTDSNSPSIINSGIANAFGYITFGAIVVILSVVALSLGSDPGGGAAPPPTGGGSQPATGENQRGGEIFGEFIGFVLMMSLPSGLVGGTMTYISNSASTNFGFKNKRQFGWTVLGTAVFFTCLSILSLAGDIDIFSSNGSAVFLLALTAFVTGIVYGRYNFDANTVRKYVAIYTGITIIFSLFSRGTDVVDYGGFLVGLVVFMLPIILLMYFPYVVTRKVIT